MTEAFTTERQTTAQLFNDVLRHTDTNWSPYRQMTANVFNAYYTRALTVEQIDGVARAIDGLPQDSSLQDALSFFVRKKVLRSRTERGKRFYEVNY
jgi:hypothetical protein